MLYLLYFVYGHRYCSRTELGCALDRNPWFLMATAGLSMALLLALTITDTVPECAYSIPSMLYQVLRGFNNWCWVLVLMGLARPWRTSSHPILLYGNLASMRFWCCGGTLAMARLSIIIPTVNEASTLARTLRCVRIAAEAGVAVLHSEAAGRAIQMNQGAREARGDLLCFLHADTLASFHGVPGAHRADRSYGGEFGSARAAVRAMQSHHDLPLDRSPLPLGGSVCRRAA